MSSIITIIILTLYAIISWQDRIRGLALLLFFLPTYLIRYQLGPLPSTFLELMLFVIVCIFLIRERVYLIDTIRRIVRRLNISPVLSLGIILFILSATLSIITSLDFLAALGEWKAFYVEPIILALITLSAVKHDRDRRLILTALVMSGGITAIVAIVQRVTGWGVPYAFWENGNSYRVTAWYGFPNAVALVVAPLIPLIFVATKKQFVRIVLITLCVLAIIFAKSTGGLVAIIGATIIYLIIRPKTRITTIAIGALVIVCIFTLPKLESVRQELLLKDRSGEIRLAIWRETLEFLRDRPLLGAGLASYGERIVPYHRTVRGEGIEIFHHPHNLFLTMWVNIGLVGLVGFILILIAVLYQLYRERDDATAEALLYTFVIIIIHGLVDSPYIKNDLSMMFWVFVALSLPKKRRETRLVLQPERNRGTLLAAGVSPIKTN